MKETKPAVFYKEVKEELQKVSWPTKEQTIGTTVVVLIVVALITAYLGGVDYVFAKLASLLMSK